MMELVNEYQEELAKLSTSGMMHWRRYQLGRHVAPCEDVCAILARLSKLEEKIDADLVLWERKLFIGPRA